jgi:hypothetical protein
MSYTKEQLLTNSAMSKMLARQGQRVKGVLTTEEQNVLAKQHKTFQVISNGKVFWFTDDYCMGVGNLLPKEFVPSSTVCPQRVAPRAGLPEGIIQTAEDFMKVYCQNERQIKTIDELVDYLNAYY